MKQYHSKPEFLSFKLFKKGYFALYMVPIIIIELVLAYKTFFRANDLTRLKATCVNLYPDTQPQPAYLAANPPIASTEITH